MTRVFKKRVIGAAATVLLLLSGCFPYVATYVHIEAPQIKRTYDVCRQHGAPAIARLETEQLSLEINLNPSAASFYKRPYLLLTVPSGRRLALETMYASISASGNQIQRIALEPMVDTVATKHRVAPSTNMGETTLYRFAFAESVASASGSLELPVIQLDGVPVQLPILQFTTRPTAGIVPLNC